jgi:hypothetical protein
MLQISWSICESVLVIWQWLVHNFAMTKIARKRASGGGRKPKDPAHRNAGWLQARIRLELESKLRQAARDHGRSLSDEAQRRLQRSFRTVEVFGPEEIKALGYLVSRVARAAQNGCAADPTDAGEQAWHRNPFTYTAVTVAVTTLLAHLRPDGSVQTPAWLLERHKERAKMLERAGATPEQIEADAATMLPLTTPEGIGRACAYGLIDQLRIHGIAPEDKGHHRHAEGYRGIPAVRNALNLFEEEMEK